MVARLIFIRRWIYRNSWQTFRARKTNAKPSPKSTAASSPRFAAQDFADPQSHLLTQAVRHKEALDDLTGKIGSYASLVYSGDTSDQVRVKSPTATRRKN